MVIIILEMVLSYFIRVWYDLIPGRLWPRMRRQLLLFSRDSVQLARSTGILLWRRLYSVCVCEVTREAPMLVVNIPQRASGLTHSFQLIRVRL